MRHVFRCVTLLQCTGCSRRAAVSRRMASFKTMTPPSPRVRNSTDSHSSTYVQLHRQIRHMRRLFAGDLLFT